MALSALIGVFSHNLQVGSIELDENIHQDLIKKKEGNPQGCERQWDCDCRTFILVKSQIHHKTNNWCQVKQKKTSGLRTKPNLSPRLALDSFSAEPLAYSAWSLQSPGAGEAGWFTFICWNKLSAQPSMTNTQLNRYCGKQGAGADLCGVFFSRKTNKARRWFNFTAKVWMNVASPPLTAAALILPFHRGQNISL